MPFLRQMAAPDSADAQMNAMVGGAFCRATGSTSRKPTTIAASAILSGALAPLRRAHRRRSLGDRRRSSATERELRRFVIETGWADYACGDMGERGERPQHRGAPRGRHDWGPWPAQPRHRRARRHSLAHRLHGTTPDDVDFTLEAEKREVAAPAAWCRAPSTAASSAAGARPAAGRSNICARAACRSPWSTRPNSSSP